jgi:hypothetical protein
VTEHDWATIRTLGIRKLGETLGPKLEDDLVKAFKENPTHVEQVIRTVIAEREAGATIGWAVIRHRIQKQPEPITASDTKERDLRIRQSEAWIRNAGLYIDLQRELISELFDEGGQLHPWRTPQLEQRMTALWENERPRGQAAEQAHEQRAADRVELRTKLKEATSKTQSTPNPSPPHGESALTSPRKAEPSASTSTTKTADSSTPPSPPPKPEPSQPNSTTQPTGSTTPPTSEPDEDPWHITTWDFTQPNPEYAE